MKPWLKITLGVLLSVFVIAFIIVWDTVIKDKIDSVEVAIVRPGVVIEKNQVITKDLLMMEQRNRATLVEGTVYKMDDVVGYEAKQKLYGNSILSERDVEFIPFTPDPEKGEAIRPIPASWIYASPSTIRRKDHIDFYLFRPEGDTAKPSVNVNYQGLSPEQKAKLEEANAERELENEKYKKERIDIAEQKQVEVPSDSESLEDVAATLEKTEELFSKVESTIKGEEIPGSEQEAYRNRIMNDLNLTEDEWKNLIEFGDIPLLVDIPIIYVKDGAGNEIQNGENSTEEKRLTSTGPVTDLEVILTEDEYRQMKKYMEQGYRLYISYN
ncbi:MULTISPECIES: SAF domain-containing protein [Bacillus]|uniref:SAF domain-containing protein n=1 Tax=Bacillus TaxID=1386 RepID=UPI00273D895F|nr:SAF domain-containing protein [Bacillus sp. MMSF_3328]